MSKVRFELNRGGVSALMKSEEMDRILSSAAANIMNRAGDGYETDTYSGARRDNAMVWAETFEAKLDNSRHNTLLKALEAEKW